MRIGCKFALILFLLYVFGQAAPVVSAQGLDGDRPVLLSAMQGHALVAFALKHDGLRPRPDCSHLVHAIFNRAGLHYAYADSRDLYNGEVDEFERISKPQPGDLAVWRGHVGIVVSPQDKTFFSSVRAGIITEPWTTDYWKMRGRPRFLRYRIGPATDQLMLARLVENGLAEEEEARSEGSASSAEATDSLKQTDSLKPSTLAETAPPEPTIVAEIRGRQKPGKQDIEAALRLSEQAGARTLGEELMDSSRPISVFDRIEVRKIKIKGNSGSVTLRVLETVAVEDGKAVPGRIIERELNLLHQDESWTISDPRERIYVPQRIAVGVFEHHAEQMLRRSPGSAYTRAMVKALDLLYDRQESFPSAKPTAEARKHGEAVR